MSAFVNNSSSSGLKSTGLSWWENRVIKEAPENYDYPVIFN